MLRWSLIVLMLLPITARARTPYADRLAAECDSLLRDAIRRPYGWGWTGDASPEPAGKATPRVISMQPLCTPAAGLALLLAGEQLDDATYRVAAEQIARGIAISQKPTGRVTTNPIFSRAPITNEERAAVADRAATRCALGLLLALIDQSPVATQPNNFSQETNRRAASRCADWLTHQLTPNNFWPSAFPADASAQATTRIVRLDDNDYRDSSVAILLAAKMLSDSPINRLVANPLLSLQKVILKNDVHGPNLWPAAVTIDGTSIPEHFPSGPDVLASRFAMQTLLAGYLLTGDRADGVALDNAAATLRQSRRADGLYDRFLDPTAAAIVARSDEQLPAATQSIFAPQPASRPAAGQTISAPFTSGAFGVWPVIEATARVKELGRDRYIAMLSARFTLHQQLEAMLCGLMDDPMELASAVSADEVPGYLSANGDRFRSLDDPMPSDLPGRVQRIWLLLIRAKLEATAATPS